MTRETKIRVATATLVMASCLAAAACAYYFYARAVIKAAVGSGAGIIFAIFAVEALQLTMLVGGIFFVIAILALLVRRRLMRVERNI